MVYFPLGWCNVKVRLLSILSVLLSNKCLDITVEDGVSESRPFKGENLLHSGVTGVPGVDGVLDCGEYCVFVLYWEE
jgi:hypothetical protein